MGNLFKPGNVAVVQLDVAGIALGDKSKVFFKLFDFGYEFGLKVLFGVNIVQALLEIFDMGIAAQDFKTIADFVNAVENGFKLGCLVDNIFRRGDLTAVMQPRGNVKRVPVIGTHFKGFEVTGGFLNGSGSKEPGNDGNPLAMAAGIRRLGIDGTRKHFNERFQEL